MKKILELKVTSVNAAEREKVEASFVEYLMKGGIPSCAGNIRFGFPHLDNSCLIKNMIVAYIDDDHRDPTDLEIRVANQFVTKVVVGRFIEACKFKKPGQIVAVDFHKPPIILKAVGKTRVSLATLIAQQKTPPKDIELKEARNGLSYVLIKSYLPSRESTLGALKNWCFENGGKKFQPKDIA